MANGMSALYVGASGLRAAQESINMTAHNLSNINTKGYTRQQVTYADTAYLNVGVSGKQILQTGIGVSVTEIRRIRDEFLDRAYRHEAGRTAFYESQYETLEEIESLFDEMEGVTMSGCIEDLWGAINELATNPGSTVKRTELIQASSAFLDRATAIYDGMIKYQNMLNVKISDMVEHINELGRKIITYNDEICMTECTGERANDIRDLRDSALDELSALMKIEVGEDKDGKVNITLEGVPFLAGNTLYEIQLRKIENSDMVVPYWPHVDRRDVFMMNEQFNANNNNDIGELKGLLISRGNLAKADYRDIPTEPRPEEFATTEEYQEAYGQYKDDVRWYNKNIGNSVMMTIMTGLDKLVNAMVEGINDVLCPETVAETDIYDADGNLVAAAGTKILDMEKTSYGMDGVTVGEELFSRKYTNRYNVYELADGSKVYVRNNINSFGDDSLYTLGNLEMNERVMQDYQLIPLGTDFKGEDMDKAGQLLEIWDVEFAALNPSKYAKENFKGFYNSMISDFANRGEVLKNMVAYQQSMTNEISSKREEKLGVYSDDELTSIIRFQNAYNASSRYINVVNEMIEHLVTRLGG